MNSYTSLFFNKLTEVKCNSTTINACTLYYDMLVARERGINYDMLVVIRHETSGALCPFPVEIM